MEVILAILLIALVGFVVADYTLGRARVTDPIRVVVAAVFAVLVAVFLRGL